MNCLHMLYMIKALLNYQKFEVLRFTGGEPLLSKWMDKFLDWLKQNSMKDAELAQEIERFCQQMTVYATLIKGGNPSQFAQHQQADK